MDYKLDSEKVYFAKCPYGQEEMDAVQQCLEEGWLGPGKYMQQFERETAKLFGKRFGVMVNSGSSALLLAAELLDIKPGDEVISTATGFPTTINPFLLKGAKVVLVDVNPLTLAPYLSRIEDAISDRTKAIVIPHIFGATVDLCEIADLAAEYGIKLVEDSCDSLGAKISGLPAGHCADISVTSFYPSHIITAGGGGGGIYVNSSDDAERLLTLRDWGRKHATEDIATRFAGELDGIPYDAKFVYEERGWNLKATEMQAAFGLVQLQRLDERNKMRRSNYNMLSQIVRRHGLRPIVACRDSESSWLTFPFLANSAAERRELALHLEQNNIQTRPILAGNLARHRAYEGANVTFDRLIGADIVAECGMGIGLHSDVTVAQLLKVAKAFEEFYG